MSLLNIIHSPLCIDICLLWISTVDKYLKIVIIGLPKLISGIVIYIACAIQTCYWMCL